MRVRSNREPLDEKKLLMSLDPVSRKKVSVGSPLNCATERNLQANLVLEEVGGLGRSFSSPAVSVPGTWELPEALGCGHFRLKGSLLDDSGGSTPLRTEELDGQEAGLLPLPPQRLEARCGEGARTTLTATFPTDTCQTPAVTWSQVAGPRLEQPEQRGTTVPLATQDTGLNELVGQTVEMRVTAATGVGLDKTLDYSLPITAAPFVKVTHRAEQPAASDTGFVGVAVDLENTTACAVDEVSYTEQLEGLSYVEGSVRFNGQEVAAEWKDGTLRLGGLPLAAQGRGTLTYLTRPHLVGERRMRGEAQLRGVTISLSDIPEGPVDSGCGCTSASSGPLLLALGALGAAARRRRPTTRS